MVIGKETREDHGQIMNTMIRFYSDSVNARQKQAMAFELSPYDEKVIRFGDRFIDNFMKLDVSMRLEDALDLAWKILADCFRPEETMMKRSLIEKYWQAKPRAAATAATETGRT